MTLDSCDQKYLDAVTAVYGANGQPDASTIRQNADAGTTSERVVGNIERFALLDALTRAEDHGTVLIDVDGHGPGAIVTAVFQIPLGSVNVTDAATLMAMASGFELAERPPGPPRKAGLTYGSDHLAPPSPTDIFRELNARETQVLKCICRGQTNEQIAIGCGLSVATVKIFVKAMMRKLGVQNRTQAAMVAMKLGFEG